VTNSASTDGIHAETYPCCHREFSGADWRADFSLLF
jgi:hypothetical protein